jgi:hypothetical protein
MPFAPWKSASVRLLACVSMLVVSCFVATRLDAQGVPTVQQSQFRSQWVGEQVDQIPLGGTATPLNSLGAVVGSLQTQDEVQREVDASLAGVQTKSPFAFKPSLGVGWQVSNQGNLQTNAAGGTSFGTASSAFASPTFAFLYDRAHGPWALSAGAATGYQYFVNPNYVGAGTGSSRNPLSATSFFKAGLEMSRYVINSLFTASAGNGYDIASGSYNVQTSVGANIETKYLVSDQSAVAFKSGYSYLNSSGSSRTPNNNTISDYINLSPIYYLSDKTHFSYMLGAGQTIQTIQQGTTAVGNTATTGNQSGNRNYVESLGKVKYNFTGKLSTDVSLGARYISSNISNSQNIGLRPAWAFGLGYTPTAKTSITFSTGEQGADIVPELNLLVNWVPRQKTMVSLGVTQSETFANSLGGQYLIQRGIIGTVTQNLFSSVTATLIGGYTTQTYVNLSSDQTNSQSAFQLPPSYYTASISVNWKIRDWVSLINSVNWNSGQQATTTGSQSTTGANSSAKYTPQAYYSISLNFAL